MTVRSRKQKMMAEINITPFTDVILVLLIIFMITTPLIYQSSLKVNLPVNLPEAKSAKLDRENKEASITITGEGLIYLDNAVITRKELQSKVSMKFKDNPDLNVLVRSDRLVRFKDIVAILDMLNELGVKHLNIAATAP